MIDINIIKCLTDNYSYLIADKEKKFVAIIDPSEFEPVDKIIRESYNKLDFILNTHHHADHIGGNSKLKEKYNAKIICSYYDKDKIPNYDLLKKNGDEFNIGNLNFKVIHTPGHTSGHIIFYLKECNTVFTGDTLFSLGCGRMFEGTYTEMFDSINKIKNLPKETLIYCGHEYTKSNYDFCKTYDNDNPLLDKKLEFINLKIKNNEPTIPISISEELETNIFFRWQDKKIRQKLNLTNSTDIEVFKKLRELKDNF